MTPLRVSNNCLATVAKCSTATVLRYVHQRQAPGESAPLKAGHAVHTCLETFWKGGSVKESLRALRAEYQEWAENNVDPDDRFLGRLGWQNIRLTMKYYLEGNALSQLPFKVNPSLVEIQFDELPITKSGDIVLIGIIDAGPVRDRKSGRLYGVDHKTTGSITAPWFLPKFRMDSQMTGYLWAMRQLTPEKVIGMYVNAIQLSKLPGLDDPTRKCRTHGVTYEDCQPQHIQTQLILIERTAQAVREWRWDAIDLARRFVALSEEYKDADDIGRIPQEGKWNGGCHFCDYADFCYAGRPVDRLSVMTAPREERAEWRV